MQRTLPRRRVSPRFLDDIETYTDRRSDCPLPRFSRVMETTRVDLSDRHFPNEAAVTRSIGVLLLEQNDEWASDQGPEGSPARPLHEPGNHRAIER